MTPAGGWTDARSLGWLASLGAHGALAFVALILTQRMTLAPQPPAFTWHVAMVAARSESPQPSSSASTPAHAPQRTAALEKPPVRDSAPPAAAVSHAAAVSAAASTTNDPTPLEDQMLSRSLSAQDSTSLRPPAPLSSPSSVHEPESPADSSLGSHQDERSPLQEAGPPAQTPTVATVATSIARPDYAWLSETIFRRMEELKRYPADARLDRIEGKVVLKAIVNSDGSVEAVEVFRSSGNESLDRAAVELLNLAAPFRFPHALGRSQMTVKIPMTYKLTP